MQKFVVVKSSASTGAVLTPKCKDAAAISTNSSSEDPSSSAPETRVTAATLASKCEADNRKEGDAASNKPSAPAPELQVKMSGYLKKKRKVSYNLNQYAYAGGLGLRLVWALK